MVSRILAAWTNRRWSLALLALLLVGALGGAAVGAQGPSPARKHHHHPPPPPGQQLHLALNPSQDVLVAQNGCMPGGRIDVTVTLSTNRVGFDTFAIRGQHLVPNQDYTIFLLQSATAPFGAAQYIGDLSTDAHGNGQNALRLIVEEAFASVNGANAIQLNRIGVWFADPAGDDGCAGAAGIGASTIFDGDGEAGIQAFNSRDADPLP